MKKKLRLKEFAFMSILIALTVVIQTISAAFPLKVAGLSISLVMVPVVIASYYFGLCGGAIVGGAFGITVFVHSIIGLDPAGAFVFGINPFSTFVATVVRGALAGFLTAFVCKGFKKVFLPWVCYIATAIVAPLFNTTLFIAIYSLLFNDLLVGSAESEGYAGNIFGFIIVGMVGINFLVELATTVLLAPPVCRSLEKPLTK